MSAETKVAELYKSHIKSGRLTQHEEGEEVRVTENGLYMDRHWMVVDSGGKFLTQREHPELALVYTKLGSKGLIIHDASHKRVKDVLFVSLNGQSTNCNAEIWGQVYSAIDEGQIAADWFSTFLGRPCRLVHMNPKTVREKRSGYGRMNFHDSWNLTVVSLASLEDLNRRIIENGRKPITIDRFRPNIVVSGCEAYAEDRWAKIKINGVVIDVVGPRVRCTVTTNNQNTGEKEGKEPLATLAKYRKTLEGEVVFAQKAASLNSGVIYINADVEVLEEKDSPKFREV